MQMPNSLAMVAEFHETFGHPVLNQPQIPDEKRCNLRVSLIQEELNELKEAIESNDLVGVADALCDIQYVLSGAVLEFGLHHAFHDLFSEVQRSNMSKACLTLEEAHATVAHFNEKGQEAYFVEKEGRYLVFRKEDEKTLKSIAYSPADLEGRLKDHMTKRSS
ncbi:MAG: nucleoside triphosphate pyrophosphohydrolase family protein [Bacteroidota bacterium]|nr:nucleoside triphosphate pyrophosphohydrolase family protein [Bacteroidota bacterium]MDX5430651.1 nucleoside triphosphate pyrophosphohydrolase family protein [Bacteroidota bacterium]MDX5469401.1 nucleoside triphosphate pyrophosphohydrolase family protein [Bacteroidota bacterium]